jgi:hypothetical protein
MANNLTKVFFSAILLSAVFLSFFSCDKNELPPLNPIPEDGFYVVCEGNFNWGNASITSYDENSFFLSQTYFKSVNGFSLGDVAQSIFEMEDKYFIVINNSAKIEVVGKEDFSSLYTITGFESPRYFQSINDSIAYVSDLFADEISIINYIDGSNLGSIVVGSWSEQMLKMEDSVYVSLYDSKSIGIIDINTHQLINEIPLEFSPTEIRKDKNGMIWVLASEFGFGSKLYKINSTNRVIENEWDFAEINNLIQIDLLESANSIYLLTSIGGVYKFPIVGTTILDPIFKVDSEGLYGLNIDEEGNIYVCQAYDFVQNGSVQKYDENGISVLTIASGISPNSIVFR